MQISVMVMNGVPTHSMLDPDNFRELAVLVPKSLDGEALKDALLPVARYDTATDHAYIEQEALSRLAGERAHDAEWRSSFESMIAYADSQGWVTDLGEVRSHIERL